MVPKEILWVELHFTFLTFPHWLSIGTPNICSFTYNCFSASSCLLAICIRGALWACINIMFLRYLSLCVPVCMLYYSSPIWPVLSRPRAIKNLHVQLKGFSTLRKQATVHPKASSMSSCGCPQTRKCCIARLASRGARAFMLFLRLRMHWSTTRIDFLQIGCRCLLWTMRHGSFIYQTYIFVHVMNCFCRK